MIELQNICAGYERKKVLHDVSMKFETGKISVLIGPNGCGKSTLLKTIVGIVKPDSGQIYADGRSIQKMHSSERAKYIAYLPQNKRTADISVLRMVLHGRFAYLKYPRRYRKEDMEIAKRALVWTGMEDHADEMVSQLSGGMQQRVYISMALAQDADTILMDEPTTYLDAAHQLHVMEMAKKLRSEGKAVVMVLHDLSQALRIADEVIVMQQGKVVLNGTPEFAFQRGILDQVFGVAIERVQTKYGWHYVYESRQDIEIDRIKIEKGEST